MTTQASTRDGTVLLTPSEAARLAQVSRDTIYREIDRGVLPAPTSGGCCVLTRTTSATTWLARGRWRDAPRAMPRHQRRRLPTRIGHRSVPPALPHLPQGSPQPGSRWGGDQPRPHLPAGDRGEQPFSCCTGSGGLADAVIPTARRLRGPPPSSRSRATRLPCRLAATRAGRRSSAPAPRCPVHGH
jgi:excisionase family DNA binding protein